MITYYSSIQRKARHRKGDTSVRKEILLEKGHLPKIDALTREGYNIIYSNIIIIIVIIMVLSLNVNNLNKNIDFDE